MTRPKFEEQIAMETEAGREALAVWHRVVGAMSGPAKVAKAFELTEMTRQIMRAGIANQYPDKTEDEIQEIYVDRLLQAHGTSLAEVRRLQMEQAQRLQKEAGSANSSS